MLSDTLRVNVYYIYIYSTSNLTHTACKRKHKDGFYAALPNTAASPLYAEHIYIPYIYSSTKALTTPEPCAHQNSDAIYRGQRVSACPDIVLYIHPEHSAIQFDRTLWRVHTQRVVCVSRSTRAQLASLKCRK